MLVGTHFCIVGGRLGGDKLKYFYNFPNQAQPVDHQPPYPVKDKANASRTMMHVAKKRYPPRLQAKSKDPIRKDQKIGGECGVQVLSKVA